LKGRYCTDADTALALPAALGSGACPYHVSVNVSADERYRVSAECADSGEYFEKTYFVLPPSWAWYYQKTHIDYQSLPPFKAGCNGESIMSMQFIYPQERSSKVHLSRQLDGSEGEITFELAHIRRSATVFWHIDGSYATATADFHRYTATLSLGKHIISVVDEQGNSLWCELEVVE
jgi:penicillin-binding protein 1C